MRYDALIIGAGLGGLSAGAFLAVSGKRVLVLERSSSLGGRCRTVEMMGHRFDIGADYFGSKMLDTYAALGKSAAIDPVFFKTFAYTDGGSMTIPPGLHTIKDLAKMGVSASGMLKLGFKMGRQLLTSSSTKQSNNFVLINNITENPHLRDVFNIGAFFTGNDPENMPGYWFNLIFGKTYGYNKPFYPRGGAGRMPEILAEVIRENHGGIVFDAEPDKVVVDGGRVKGVMLQGRLLEADNVISGISVVPTVHRLVGKEYFPFGFLDTLSYYREGLPMASMFVVFNRKAAVKKGVHIYARFARNLRAMFRVLGEGRFPEKSMFILSCPDAALGTGTENIAGTVKFLVPKGVTSRPEIEAEAAKVVKDVDLMVPGFNESIVEGKLYTPEDYKKEFGFKSYVTPIAESIHYEKFPVELPVKGLYCAGATVLPVGGCTASAVESGRDCANRIIKGDAG
jgi:phytoene desaturase